MGKFGLEESLDQMMSGHAGKKRTASATENGAERTPKAAEKAPQGAAYHMLNIRFEKANADYLKKEAALRGLSITKFVNWIVEQYRMDPDHVHDSGVFGDESAW